LRSSVERPKSSVLFSEYSRNFGAKYLRLAGYVQIDSRKCKMSALGTTRTYQHVRFHAAIGGKADVERACSSSLGAWPSCRSMGSTTRVVHPLLPLWG